MTSEVPWIEVSLKSKIDPYVKMVECTSVKFPLMVKELVSDFVSKTIFVLRKIGDEPAFVVILPVE